MSSLVITPLIVESIMKYLPLEKTVGPDGIHNRILWECSRELSHPLCFLINPSYSLGILPETWKDAMVFAISKKEICHLFLIIVQFPSCPVWKK